MDTVKYNLYLSDRALAELKEATEYYGGISASVNERFGIAIEQSLFSIRQNPLAYAIRYATMRCAVVPAFPFIIHFELEEKKNLILVTSVFNIPP
jgi:plasmid stabilization system protein ParE